MPDSYSVILTSTGSQEEADRLAELLVSRRLAACVQIIPVASCYRWQGQMTREPEFLLLVKTAAQQYPAVEAALLEQHSYDLPEILELPVGRGLERYLGWISENTA